MQNGKTDGGVIKAALGACGNRIAVENVGNDVLIVTAGNARELEPQHQFELEPGQKVCLPKGSATEFDIVAVRPVTDVFMVEALLPLGGGLALPLGMLGAVVMDGYEMAHCEQLVLVPNAK
jgi:hypothetical protein